MREGVVRVHRGPRRDVLYSLSALSLLPHRSRAGILRRAGVEVGADTFFLAGTRFTGPHRIRIGGNVFVNYDCYFDAGQGDITIGDGVRLGDHVRLLTSTHELGPAERRAGPVCGRPVVIGAGTWVGSSVSILPGVTVGAGCVIAAGAVVTKDCGPDELLAGVPARPIRSLPTASG